MQYPFEKAFTFSTDGGMDELIALDRYAASTVDPAEMHVGDTVIFIYDELKGSRFIGTITKAEGDTFDITARNGQAFGGVRAELVTKPLETQPADMWNRWAYGAALVEREEDRDYWTKEFAGGLFDGWGYSPGGRIQLGLGHEYLGLPKAPLTLTNCFVLKPTRGVHQTVEAKTTEAVDAIKEWRKAFTTVSPEAHQDAIGQWNNVIDTVLTEMQISRRGGGVGINISNICTVNGADKVDVVLSLAETHKDYAELQNLAKLGKFAGVKLDSSPRFNRTVFIKVEDSIEGHIEALRDMVRAIYSGRQVVVNFSNVRHRNAVVLGVNGRSSGAAAWMELFAVVARLAAQATVDAVDFAEIFSFVINLIQQGGSRRGALMLVCNDDHPAVSKFIQRKRTPGFLQGANISVGLSEGFMARVKREDEEALGLWNLIIESAHASAEPGVIWLERYNLMSNSWYYAAIVATNPCGEQGLPEDGACNLGHLVLPTYVVGDWIHGKATVDWNKLARAVRIGMRFQDNMVDYGLFPTEDTKSQQMMERRVGMGTMGLGTMLIMLGLRYGSTEAEAFLDRLYSFIALNAYDASIDLAKEKGAFPAFIYEKHIKSGFMKHLLAKFPKLKAKLRKYGIRNATLLTQAPTGSTGTYIDNIPGMNTSTGIEPYYSFVYYRASRLGEGVMQEVELVKQYREAHHMGADDALPDFFVTAMELPPEAHVQVQAAVQRWVDSSISKTANAPNSYTIEDTAKLYMQAYDTGCKGMTIYRDGSRQAQVLSTDQSKAKLESHLEADKLLEALKVEEEAPVEQPAAMEFNKRPSRMFGFTEKVKVMQGNHMAKVYITVNMGENGLPVEVFVSSNDAEVKPTAEALGRMTTQFLRFSHTEDNIEQAVKHLRMGQTFGTLPWHVAKLLDDTASGKIEFPGAPKPKQNAFKVCEDCGEKAFDKANCICHACGSSHCN